MEPVRRFVLRTSEEPVDASDQFPVPDQERRPPPPSKSGRLAPADGEPEFRGKVRPRRPDFRLRRVAVSTTNPHRPVAPVTGRVRAGIFTLSASSPEDVATALRAAHGVLVAAFESAYGTAPAAVTTVVHAEVTELEGRLVGRYSLFAADEALVGAELDED